MRHLGALRLRAPAPRVRAATDHFRPLTAARRPVYPRRDVLVPLVVSSPLCSDVSKYLYSDLLCSDVAKYL